jgi:hypothetical protein
MLQTILLAAIVILLLVVLVPAAVALFQRVRSERTPPPSRPKPLPPQPISNVPTAKVVAPPEVNAAPPAPPSPKKIERTQLDDIPQSPAADAPAGTQMVQWYGMLNCTSGPLAGQRFVVEDEGFYIGRDPVLSTVVIPDTRVSKRHVRIVPRDGRVWAIDQGSLNGTFLAGSNQRITEVQLKRGDTLVLGDNAATFVYQI